VNKQYEFKINTNKKYITLIINKKFIHLNYNGNGLFSLNTVIPKNIDKIDIGVSDIEYGKYNIIAEYEVSVYVGEGA
jgi:hypothetical protein